MNTAWKDSAPGTVVVSDSGWGQTVQHCWCNTIFCPTTSLFLLNKAEINCVALTMLYNVTPILDRKLGLSIAVRQVIHPSDFGNTPF